MGKNTGTFPPWEKPLAERVRRAIERYPCHILFVHRDAERTDAAEISNRVEEIRLACSGLEHQSPGLEAVCVIPVRMTEAWLLFDEAAIRRASGNPQGRVQLKLPSVRQVERIHAKDVLHRAIRDASELTGRRAKKLDIQRAIHDVGAFINDFRPLDQVPGFSKLREELGSALRSLGLGG